MKYFDKRNVRKKKGLFWLMVHRYTHPWWESRQKEPMFTARRQRVMDGSMLSSLSPFYTVQDVSL